VNVPLIPRAVDSYLRLVRLPLDGAIRLLPGDGGGARSAATLALDRADASVRSKVAAALGDEALLEDAEHRREAIRNGERAVRLRGQAERTAEHADARLRQRQEQTTRQRARADERAQKRRQEITGAQEIRQRNAASTKRKRLDASRLAAEDVEQTIAEREPQERLSVAETRSDALRQKEKELTARDEARRLREATERTKTERKESPGTT
jgi:hypothetical protein